MLAMRTVGCAGNSRRRQPLRTWIGNNQTGAVPRLAPHLLPLVGQMMPFACRTVHLRHTKALLLKLRRHPPPQGCAPQQRQRSNPD